MTRVLGVRFREAGKVYFFDPGDLDVHKDDKVIVETSRGIEIGTVVLPPVDVDDEKVQNPLKPVLRKAVDLDIRQEAANREKEKEAFKICQEKIRAHELEMKLVDVEYTFDNNKILFYFTADGRIDFRDLVKDLAAVFKTRIELRQIGVRDETKILGGIGICGRVLCCHAHLSDFAPVSIKMAKEQNLSLNPTKISGACGRLMCCLNNEEETYEELNRRLPGLGDTVTASDGVKGTVHSVNILRQTVKVLVEQGDEKELHEYRVEDLSFTGKKNKNRKNNNGDNAEPVDEAALELLEEKESDSVSAFVDDEEERGEKPNRREHRESDFAQGAENSGRENRGNNSAQGGREGNHKNRNRHKGNNHSKGDRGEATENRDKDRRENSGERKNHHKDRNRDNQKDGQGKDGHKNGQKKDGEGNKNHHDKNNQKGHNNHRGHNGNHKKNSDNGKGEHSASGNVN